MSSSATGIDGDDGRAMATDRLVPEEFATDDEREATAAQLRRQRDFYRHLFREVVEAFPHPVGVVDEEGVVAHWNEGLADLVRIPASEAVGEQAYDVVGTEGEDEVLSEKVARLGETIVEDRVRTGRTPEGDLWAVKGAGFPLTAPDGHTVGALQVNTVVTDIVERNRDLGALHSRITDEVATATEQLRSSLTETADHSEAIRETTVEQSDRLADIHDELATVSDESDAVADRAREVDERGDAIRGDTERSEEAVANVVETLDRAVEAAETVRENAADLEDRADEITSVTDTIADIAEQTNLLALNANIEAARVADSTADAGGFEVVADEVKELAERSRSEAERVGEQVEAVRETIGNTVENVRSLDEDLDAAVEETRDLETTQTAISRNVRGVAGELTAVADAVDDHAGRMASLESEVADFADRTETVAERTGEIADATTEQTETVRRLDEAVKEVAAELDRKDLEIEV